MSGRATLPLVRGTDRVGDCRIEHAQAPPWWIVATLEGGREIRAEASDLPSALAQVRLELLDEGLDLACQGSRRDVRASPMMIESTGGRRAYRIRMGVPARREDVVGLFDETSVGELASVEEQARYHRAWLESLEASDGERAEARSCPGGWVYRIDGRLDPDGEVPPEGIVGAWKVSDGGVLTGEFEANDGYRPERIGGPD